MRDDKRFADNFRDAHASIAPTDTPASEALGVSWETMPERRFKLTLLTAEDVEDNRDSFLIIESQNRETRVIIDVGDAEPVWECGSCGSALMVGVQPGQVRAIVLRCPTCRAYNHTSPPVPPG